MATNKVLVVTDQQFSFADHAGDYTTPTATNEMELGTPVDVELDLGLALTDAAAVVSSLCSLPATRAPRYSLDALVELQATPTTGQSLDFYWATKNVADALNGNPGYIVGSATVSALYTGTPATLAEASAQLLFIGSMRVSADAVAQTAHIGVFSPPARYGYLVVVNNSGATTVADGN